MPAVAIVEELYRRYRLEQDKARLAAKQERKVKK